MTSFRLTKEPPSDSPYVHFFSDYFIFLGVPTGDRKRPGVVPITCRVQLNTESATHDAWRQKPSQAYLSSNPILPLPLLTFTIKKGNKVVTL